MPEQDDTQPNEGTETIDLSLDSYMEDGKILGRYGSVQEMFDDLKGQSQDGEGDSGNTQGDPPPTNEEVTIDSLTIEEGGTAGENVSDADLTRYGQEALANGGKLEDSSYEELAKQGYSRELVDTYIQGQMALREQQTQAVVKAAGGPKAVQQALAWAQKNMTPAERIAFNKTMNEGSVEDAKLVMAGLVARANIVPDSVSASTSPGLSATPYPNETAFQDAINDPRYNTSEEYRLDVQRRAKASMTAGTIQ